MTVSEAFGSLSILVTAAEADKDRTKGLLGVVNGDPTDDLTTPNGTVIPSNSSQEEIFHNFGVLCKKCVVSLLIIYMFFKSFVDFVAFVTLFFKTAC